MVNDQSEKVSFRLRHLVPRNFISSFHSSHSGLSDKGQVVRYLNPDGSEEIEFQMTWGKIAGKVCQFRMK